MAETMKEAVTFIEQGHVRVGTETVGDFMMGMLSCMGIHGGAWNKRQMHG